MKIQVVQAPIIQHLLTIAIVTLFVQRIVMSTAVVVIWMEHVRIVYLHDSQIKLTAVLLASKMTVKVILIVLIMLTLLASAINNEVQIKPLHQKMLIISS